MHDRNIDLYSQCVRDPRALKTPKKRWASPIVSVRSSCMSTIFGQCSLVAYHIHTFTHEVLFYDSMYQKYGLCGRLIHAHVEVYKYEIGQL